MGEKEQTRRLAHASADRGSSDEEDGTRKLRKRRGFLCYTGTAIGAIVGLLTLMLVLALTLFRVKEPIISVKSFHLDGMNLISNTPLFAAPQPAFNLTLSLTSHVSIKNPNAASFRFDNSTTILTYRGSTVGEALTPAGEALPRRTMQMNVTVHVLADQLAGESLNLLISDAASGSLTVRSFTKIGGRVAFLSIFKRHVDMLINCTVIVFVSNKSIPDQSCIRTVHL